MWRRHCTVSHVCGQRKHARRTSELTRPNRQRALQSRPNRERALQSITSLRKSIDPTRLKRFSLVDRSDTPEYRLVLRVGGPIRKYCSHSIQRRVTTSISSCLKVPYTRARNRLNFQILAYLLTIDLLYGTRCLSY